MSMSQVGFGLPRRLAERYDLVEQLASGNTTSVWRGHDRVLGRDVVVKVLHPDLAADASLRGRFHQEAVNAARLTHPNIVALYDTGEQQGVNYIVMELVEGPTLRDVLNAHGPLSPAQAARLACEVLHALDYAHQAGVVHRNLKPANILLCGDGSVKVADFSIARAVGDEGSADTGELLTDGAYLAPELAGGAEPDGRADVYGLGACLFEMLTGRPPGSGGQSRGSTAPLSPRAVRAGVPRDLDVVVQRAMALAPDDRYPSARTMAEAMARSAAEDGQREPLLAGAAPQPLPPAETAPAPSFLRHEGRWLGWTLVVVGLVAALVVAGLTLDRSGVISLPGTHQSGSGKPSRTTVQPATLKFVGAQAYDPLADGQENNARTGEAIDGDPSTAWRTQHYKTPNFGGLKTGVGMVLDLGSPRRARQLDLELLSSGADLVVYGANTQAPNLDGWTPNRLGGMSGAPRDVSIDLSGASYRYYLVWFTRLPPAPDGQYQGGIAEASLRP